MPIIVSAPTPPVVEVVEPAPPRIRVPARDCLRSVWFGWDGTVWDLNDDATGVCLAEGVRGLHMPPISHYRTASPAVAGSRYTGTRVAERDVFWPLRVWSDGSPTDFAELDRAFWRTMDPTRTGTWTWIQPTGESRSIDLRYDTSDGTWDQDPLLAGFNVYGVTLTAEQPFWRGDDIEGTTRVFTIPDPEDFFVEPGATPPGVVHISPGSDFATATLANPGDVPGWITWTITGPLEAVTVGVRRDAVNYNIPIPTLLAGQTLTVYTDPERMFAVNDAGDQVTLSPLSRFAPVPAYGTTQLAITMAATGPGGSITAALTPYFYRAY